VIDLLARDDHDGWAVALEGEQRWLLLPPYRLASRRPITAADSLRLVLDHGLTPCDASFADWGALTRDLTQARIRAFRDEAPAAKDAWKRVLRTTTASRAAGHLDTIASWITAGRNKEAQQALIALLQAPAVQTTPALVQRAAELMATADVPAAPPCAPRSYPTDEDGLRRLQQATSALLRPTG
jgi:hypothetical protein